MQQKSKAAPTNADRDRKDEYNGKYRPNDQGKSPQELWGTNLNPVQETPTPYKGLRKAGG